MLTVVNRTNKIVTGTWGGRQYDLVPFGTEEYPEDVAKAMKRQNPVMGSGDPRDSEAGMTGRMIYKVGIKELKDPTDPLPGNLKEGVERWNRDKLIGAKPTQIVAGDNGIYSGRDVASRLPLDPTIMGS